MSIDKAYSEWATTYDSDRNLTRDLDAKMTREILGQQHYDTILEVGCGTGKNTPFYLQLGDRVLALDFSEGMIIRARAKLSSAPVQFAVADLTRPWPCAAQAVDLVVCNLVLEHIANLEFIFAQAQRVLAPQGQFYICELHPFKQYQGKKATFQSESGQVYIPAYVHHISDFVNAAIQADFTLRQMGEWWHDDDQGLPPRVVSFLFEKGAI